MEGWIAALDVAARELTLFAAAGFLVGGADDLLVDLLWLARRVRERFRGPLALGALPQPPTSARLAVFVAAWREERVIGPMLRAALGSIRHPDYRIYVGLYPNDPATAQVVAEVARDDPRVRPVVGPCDGPTTKAGNLNVLWEQLLRDDAAAGAETLAIVLHDAEDVIHADELAVHQALLLGVAAVQVPVVPLIDRHARLVSAHYADEFAESHGKGLVVRAGLGAGLPLAGVGCAIRVSALRRIAALDGAPFDPASLTEDYELGLKLTALGLPVRFARVCGDDGVLVATRAFFPSTVRGAVTQKARWMTGIALAGWDRIGWARPLAIGEHWMRMRDRRAPLAVLVLAAAYLALLGWGASAGAHALAGTSAPPWSAATQALLVVNAGLLAWRIAMRVLHTACAHGLAEGLRAVPRMVVANFVALLAVRRALVRYVRVLGGGVPRWDKTEHVFPDLPGAGAVR